MADLNLAIIIIAQTIELSLAEKKALLFLKQASKATNKQLLAALTIKPDSLGLLFSEQEARISPALLDGIIHFFSTNLDCLNNFDSLPPPAKNAVPKVIEAFKHRAFEAANNWDLSFLAEIPVPPAKTSSFSLADLGFAENPAADKSKKKEVLRIQSELTGLIVELRSSNNPDDADLRNILIHLLKSLLIFLNDDGTNPPSKIPTAPVENARRISDHLKNLETASDSAQKSYTNLSTILGGLLKLLGISA